MPTKPKKRSGKVAKKTRRRKNPKKVTAKAYQVTTVTKKKRKKKTTGRQTVTMPTRAEVTRAKQALLGAKAEIQELQLKKRAASKKIDKNRYSKLIAKAKAKYDKLDKAYRNKQGQLANLTQALNMEIKKARAAGNKISKTVEVIGGSKPKKKRKKKVAKKKKTTRKKSASKKKRKTKKKSSSKKKTTRKKRKTKKKSTSKKKVTRKLPK